MLYEYVAVTVVDTDFQRLNLTTDKGVKYNAMCDCLNVFKWRSKGHGLT